MRWAAIFWVLLLFLAPAMADEGVPRSDSPTIDSPTVEASLKRLQVADPVARREARAELERGGALTVARIRTALRRLRHHSEEGAASLRGVFDTEPELAFWVLADVTGYVTPRLRAVIAQVHGERAEDDPRSLAFLLVHALFDNDAAIRQACQDHVLRLRPELAGALTRLARVWDDGDLVPLAPAYVLASALRAGKSSSFRDYFRVFSSRFGCDAIEAVFARVLLDDGAAPNPRCLLQWWRTLRPQRTYITVEEWRALQFATELVAHLVWFQHPRQLARMLANPAQRDIAVAVIIRQCRELQNMLPSVAAWMPNSVARHVLHRVPMHSSLAHWALDVVPEDARRMAARHRATAMDASNDVGVRIRAARTAISLAPMGDLQPLFVSWLGEQSTYLDAYVALCYCVPSDRRQVRAILNSSPRPEGLRRADLKRMRRPRLILDQAPNKRRKALRQEMAWMVTGPLGRLLDAYSLSLGE